MSNLKKVGAYVRISHEDLIKDDDYSYSIYNQLALIKSYAKTIGLDICEEYIDDGFSGVNFDRPGFEKLMDDIENGIIDCIITKDMSRLGRNFLETGYYISEYFPKKGVRFISINDSYDSDNSGDEQQDMIFIFKSIINDFYVKEISVKRKKTAELKTNNGEFIGGFAPYGYKVVKIDKKRTLEIDEESSIIVKRIFNEIANGKSRREVADSLNKDKIPPPVIYMNITTPKEKKYYYDWSDKIVYRILKNQTYMGKIVKRKSKKDNYLQKKREVIPIREREVIDNCHPVIIDEKLFYDANNKLRTLTKAKLKSKRFVGLFSDLVVCGECGEIMRTYPRNDRNNGSYYYKCGKLINRKVCSNRMITNSKLKIIVDNLLKEMINVYVDDNDIVSQATQNLIKSERNDLKISQLKEDVNLYNKNIRELYLKKTKGEISLEKFLEEKSREESLKENAEKLLKEKLELKNHEIRKNEILEKYNQFINDGEFIDNSVKEFIDKIIVYKDNTIEISFKFGLGEPKKIKLF